MDSNFSDVVLRQGGSRRCRVLYSYSPQNDDELQLQVNDEIDFLDEVEDGWWKGKLGNKIGVFPSNFVCDLTNEESCQSEGEISAPLSSPDSAMTEEAPILPPKPIKETCRVLFAYSAANDDELTLKKDDIITIIAKEVEDKGWWKGELRGKVGLFPDNFVELISPTEEMFIGQPKKPDRPTKSFDKIDSKIPLISTSCCQKLVQDNSSVKNLEEKMIGSKNEGPFIKKNSHNSEKGKLESPGTKFAEKNLNCFQPKMELITTNRKSLETKPIENQVSTSVGKKPVLPPPLANKPKPIAGKSIHVKRLSEEINDLIENNTTSKSSGCPIKRLSGEIHDLIDGGISSKLGCVGQSPTGGLKEDLDLDIIERSDMLTHITSSRPRPPGRRLPSKETKENESHISLTNGNVETSDKEKNQREREWEKHKPPWVNELKLNLKASKNSSVDSKFEKKSTSVKSSPQSPIEVSSTTAAPESPSATVLVRQFSPQLGSPRTQSMFETVSKVSELSSKFSLSDKAKAGTSVSPSKPTDISYNALDQSIDDVMQISRKEFMELKYKVNKLAELVMQLTVQLAEEVDKRKLIEKELNKLTDLVTQVHPSLDLRDKEAFKKT